MEVQKKHELVSSVDLDGIELGHAGRPERVESLGSEPRSRASTTSQQDSRLRSPTFSPVALDQAPTVLTFTNLTVTTRTRPKKTLLHNVSGSITGGFWAIMGASGGGKTTLLSTLSLRLDSNYMDIQGEFRLNGREYSRGVLKAMSAYVMQDDLLHAELTVQETLVYAAKLRMASGFTTEQRMARVDEVLALMKIEHTRGVIIGSTRKKGISGGERKRVSVAMELLNKPKLLFLDEPTSGLDSSTAFTVTQCLQILTALGECTVVCTIHQPQPKIFLLFDNVVLMKKGEIVYQGAVSKLDSFLVKVGFPCPADANIADHVLDVLSPASEAEEVIAANKLTPPVNLSLGIDKEMDLTTTSRSWYDQYTILVQRNWQTYVRGSDLIVMNFLITCLLAIFIGSGLWYQIGTNQLSVTKRVPSLFFICITQGIVGSLQSINSFPGERAIMLRERAAGTYRVSAYFAAKTTVDLFTQTWPPILFSCIAYFLIGYQNVASKFFMFTFAMVLDCLAATSLATLVTCVCVSIELSTVVLCLCFEVCRLFGGFFASPTVMEQDAPHFAFLDALSYIKYAFLTAAITELQDLELTCDPDENCNNPVLTGRQTIAANGYDDYTVGYCIGILFVFIVGCRLFSYLALRYIKM